jgi:acylphosphatase
MTATRARLAIAGRVQGVWYRGAMQEEARRLGVAGWVRNRRDGTVEAEVEGEQALVDALVAWTRQGPPGAHVTDVRVDWITPLGEQGTFAIRY